MKRASAKKRYLWSLACIFGLQLGLIVYMEARHAEIFDPEYRDRLVTLRQRVREQPDRPLLLFIGSSRVMTGIAPEEMPMPVSAAGEHPLPFNACHTGAGPVHNLVMVHRLLRAGFAPRWLVVEVVPYLLPAAQQSTVAKMALAEDLPVLRRYVSPGKLYGWYAAERATGIVNHRGAYLRCLAPGLPLQEFPWDCMPMEALGGKHWHEPIPTRAEIERATAVVRATCQASLQRFSIHESSRRAIEELLELCRQQNIHVVFLLTPECSEFRSLYPPEAQRTLAQFVGEISSAHAVPVIDARDWLPDEAFSDGHHVLPNGSKRFTARLATDVIRPFVRGELHRISPGTSNSVAVRRER